MVEFKSASFEHYYESSFRSAVLQPDAAKYPAEAGQGNNRDGDHEIEIYKNHGYAQCGGFGYFAAYGAVIRVTDTSLDYQLGKASDTAAHNRASFYLGRPHQKIEFQIPSSPPLTLYVDDETG